MQATGPGTKEYFAHHSQTPHSPLGQTGLQVSSVGFGCYRVSEYEPEHREALKQALTSGVNLIDTSTNYTDGSSERLVGEVLENLFHSDAVKRENVVVVTKVGYVQGQNLRDSKDRASQGYPFPEMVEYSNDCWHNISPEFLQEQITKSLARLRLERIDVLLLHNPEYFLKTSHNRDQYYERIKKAFEYLEAEVANKRIQFYGISSNTFPDNEASSEFTSLERVLEIAKSIRKNHHFAVVQLPMNLFESGAAFNKNNAKMTALEFAEKNKLGVLINRPLNAFFRNRLIRLSSFTEHDEVEIKGNLHIAMGRAIELEKKFGGNPPHGLHWAHVLRDKLNQLDDLMMWREALYQQIYPSINKGLARLEGKDESWSQEYKERISEILRLITNDLESLQARKAQLLCTQLDEAASDLSSSVTLSQKALRIYRSLGGVSSVLVGMRKPEYVNDSLQLDKPLLAEDALHALRIFQKYR